MDNQALIAALEQARAALDAVEVASTQGRRERLSKPAPEAPETCEGCGKAGGDCACEGEPAEME